MGTCEGCRYLYASNPSLTSKGYHQNKEKWECHKEVEPIELMVGRKACKDYCIEVEKALGNIPEILTPEQLINTIKEKNGFKYGEETISAYGIDETHTWEAGLRVRIEFDNGLTIEYTKEK